ncbi:MAG: DNA polymerase III subunit delta' [Candidatus Sedimenticola endophacoides]
MPQSMHYPWHQENRDKLWLTHQAGKLPHALLLSGARGLGKHPFAIRFAASLLCREPAADGVPCGACQGCRLFRAGTHPDYRRIEPEAPGKAIRVDAIREFISREGLTSQAGRYKITIIEPADALNVAAANSLLKTLEEPVPHTLIILITAHPGRLPATIRSRCQHLKFAPPGRPQALQWLQEQGVADAGLLLDLTSGAPLQALGLSEPDTLGLRLRMIEEFEGIFNGGMDPVEIASRWSRLDQPQTMQWLNGWIIDLIRLKISSGHQTLINSDQGERLTGLALRADLEMLYNLLDTVYEAIRTLGSQLNAQMVLESMLLDWSGCRQR